MSARCGRALPVLRIEAASCYGRGGDYVCKFSKKNPDSRFLSRKTERFRQAVRGMPPKEVKFEHARGEQKAEPSLHYRAHRPHRPTDVEAGWVFAVGHCQKQPTFRKKQGRNGEKSSTFL